MIKECIIGAKLFKKLLKFTKSLARRSSKDWIKRPIKTEETRKLRDQAWIWYFKDICESLGAKADEESKMILEGKQETMLNKNTSKLIYHNLNLTRYLHKKWK
jgi:hypothetical protein